MTCGRWARAQGVAYACKGAQGMTCGRRADRRKGRQASGDTMQAGTPGKQKSKRSGRKKAPKTLKTPTYEFIFNCTIFFILRYLRYILHLGVIFREIFGNFFGIIGKQARRFYFLYHSLEITGSNGFLLSDVMSQNRNFTPF